MTHPEKQIELIEKIQAIDINLVTCGDCGVVQLVDTTVNEVVCYDCDSVLEQCDCPDLFHDGMTLNGETINYVHAN